MTRDEVIARWEARLIDWARLNVQVNGEALAREVLNDLRGMVDAYESASLTLTTAAAESGYSRRQLTRMIAEGKLANVGRHNAPRVLRKDLPRKPAAGSTTGAVRGSPLSSLQIARQAISSKSAQRGRGNGTQG